MILRPVFSALALVLVLVGCDGAEEVGGINAESSLVFTREDGTTVPFEDRFYVWCGAWEPGEVDTPAVHVLAGRPTDERWWTLSAVRADVGAGSNLSFPNDFIWDQPEGAQLFILDGDNELSTGESESSGSITFQEVSCERGGTVRFSIDAVVGSEFGDGETMRVTGSFRGTVGNAPF